MKSIFIFIAGFVVGYVFTITGCNAQTTYLYGAQGQSLGTVQQSGNTQYFYGPQGQSAGTAMQSGNTTYVYGPQGQSLGTVMAPVGYIPMPYTAPVYNPSSMTPIYDSIFGR
jgi:YD repeat-containing protein